MSYHPTAWGRGFNDAYDGLSSHVEREHPVDRGDYKNGYAAGLDQLQDVEAGNKPFSREESEPEQPTPTAAQSLIDKIVADTQRSREVVMDNLMRNPGFLATMGDDFIADFGPVTTFTVDDPEINPLDALHIRVEHTIVVRSREFVDRQLKEQSLRQDTEGNLESV